MWNEHPPGLNSSNRSAQIGVHTGLEDIAGNAGVEGATDELQFLVNCEENNLRRASTHLQLMRDVEPIQFVHRNVENNYVRLQLRDLGNDGARILDGTNNLEIMFQDALGSFENCRIVIGEKDPQTLSHRVSKQNPKHRFKHRFSLEMMSAGTELTILGVLAHEIHSALLGIPVHCWETIWCRIAYSTRPAFVLIPRTSMIRYL
jgi:hypothetical protein